MSGLEVSVELINAIFLDLYTSGRAGEKKANVEMGCSICTKLHTFLSAQRPKA